MTDSLPGTRHKRARAALFWVALLLLGGCASDRSIPSSIADLDVIASDSDYALVRLKSGQEPRDLARVYLGSEQEVWQLWEVNADPRAQAGQLLAVPLSTANVSSVYTNGYRTLPILCYHQFSAVPDGENRLELSARRFEQQVRYLMENDYQLLSFVEVNEIMQGDRPIPAKGIVLTIDDGYRSVYDIAWPILRKYGAKATLFIYTDFIGAGRALTWAQLQEMAASGLIEIESHGKSHTSLSRLREDHSQGDYQSRVKGEIVDSGAVFKRHLGKVPEYLSYPYGNSSATASRIVAGEGYRLAATVTRGDNTTFADPYLLHRTMIYGDHDMDDFVGLLVNFRQKSLK